MKTTREMKLKTWFGIARNKTHLEAANGRALIYREDIHLFWER